MLPLLSVYFKPKPGRTKLPEEPGGIEYSIKP